MVQGGLAWGMVNGHWGGWVSDGLGGRLPASAFPLQRSLWDTSMCPTQTRGFSVPWLISVVSMWLHRSPTYPMLGPHPNTPVIPQVNVSHVAVRVHVSLGLCSAATPPPPTPPAAAAAGPAGASGQQLPDGAQPARLVASDEHGPMAGDGGGGAAAAGGGGGGGGLVLTLASGPPEILAVMQGSWLNGVLPGEPIKVGGDHRDPGGWGAPGTVQPRGCVGAIPRSSQSALAHGYLNGSFGFLHVAR